MPYEVFLAFRYLRSRPKRRLARVTALLAVLGITMGVAALIVALALANGFRDEMREKILQGTAHLTVLRKDGKPVDDHVRVIERIRQTNGVVSASTTTYDGVLAYGPKRGPAYAVLRGIENDGGNLTQGRKWLKAGSFDSLFVPERPKEVLVPDVVIGAELASKLEASVGDLIDVIPGNPIGPFKFRLRVAGIFQSGLFEYDSTWVFLDLQKAAAITRATDASVISVQVNDADNVKRIAANVLSTLGNDFTAIDWQQANQPLFAALALERRMGAFIVGLIIAIAVLNITTMLILVVVERRRDIAILSTLGATRTGVMLVFMIEGAVVGAIGALAGVLIGLAACFIGNRYKLVSLPADVYSISNVPFNATAKEVALAALIAFGLSVLATIYPARNAARLRPVEVLRDA
jgi:lipoprotein-releasing system permease protein